MRKIDTGRTGGNWTPTNDGVRTTNDTTVPAERHTFVAGITYVPDAPASGMDPYAGIIAHAGRAGWTVTEDATPPTNWAEATEAYRAGDLDALLELALV